MRLMQSNLSAITVIGNVKSVAIGLGSVVDVDQVVAVVEGKPRTLGDELGALLEDGFAPVGAAAPAPVEAVEDQE